MNSLADFIGRLLGYKIFYLPATRIVETPFGYKVLTGPLVRCKYKEAKNEQPYPTSSR